MGTLTIRLDDKQEEVIDTLKKHYRESASTKAVLKAAANVPVMQNEINKLERELSQALRELSQLRSASNNFLSSLEQLKVASDSKKTSRNRLDQLDLIAD
ncbi:hypothetical protein INR79_09735 [Vibrio sp. SCSIO 43132]|uniref:hypothetical protein n=1 Tax=Vibrio sp. SCSIO 43132 TaxID=2779363 RepID=UPI001CA9EEBF|nr:hypothetical protein [Vibrio sp. SCSIO 43132]UAB68828.1 hypothetical protein INR79_09735 [Vibrio sp. SCSIO 43132]